MLLKRISLGEILAKKKQEQPGPLALAQAFSVSNLTI